MHIIQYLAIWHKCAAKSGISPPFGNATEPLESLARFAPTGANHENAAGLSSGVPPLERPWHRVGLKVASGASFCNSFAATGSDLRHAPPRPFGLRPSTSRSDTNRRRCRRHETPALRAARKQQSSHPHFAVVILCKNTLRLLGIMPHLCQRGMFSTTFRDARKGVFVTRVGELSCRGHLTQTEGRGDAETTGEGRPDSAISVMSKKPHRDLQATASTRRLKRRNAARQMRRVSWFAPVGAIPS